MEDEDDWGFEHPETPTVWDDDPNPIIGEILDRRGEFRCQVRMEPERRMGYSTGGLHSPVGVVGKMGSGAVGKSPDVSAWRVESPTLTVSAGKTAGHHDMVTGVQELVRFKAYYSGATPVLREDCPYVVHDAVGAMPSSAIRHALTVLDPLDIRSQNPASNSEITATERLVGVPEFGHIGLRHCSIPSPRM